MDRAIVRANVAHSTSTYPGTDPLPRTCLLARHLRSANGGTRSATLSVSAPPPRRTPRTTRRIATARKRLTDAPKGRLWRRVGSLHIRGGRVYHAAGRSVASARDQDRHSSVRGYTMNSIHWNPGLNFLCRRKVMPRADQLDPMAVSKSIRGGSEL
jgi:hypothetical protein